MSIVTEELQAGSVRVSHEHDDTEKNEIETIPDSAQAVEVTNAEVLLESSRAKVPY